MCRNRSTPTNASDGSSQPQRQQRPGTTSPFSVRQLTSSTYLIRENDSYGEHPHVYAKLLTHPTASPTRKLIVLIDTGVGTSTSSTTSISTSSTTTTTGSTNLWTFLASTLNPSHTHPYLVILSHCHYDHILGLSHAAGDERIKLTIAASSFDRAFVTPYATLQEHSLCEDYGIEAPRFSVEMWAGDGTEIVLPVAGEGGTGAWKTGLVALHTPGHTPDSLSVFDEEERVLYVGDSFYAQVSGDTEGAEWGKEEAAPIIFPKEGDLGEWWRGVGRLVGFVERMERVEGGSDGEGKRKGKVLLAAGHVTAGVEAYAILLRVRAFMGRVLREEIEVVELPDRRGERMRMWHENREGKLAEFSLVAPLRIIKEGRKRIPAEKWKNGGIN